MKLLTIFNSIIESKIGVDLKTLESDVLNFRQNEEAYNEWDTYKTCFKGTCQDVTLRLMSFLLEKGYDVIRIGGYYKGASPNYYPDTDEWDRDDIRKFERSWERNGDAADGLKFKHWWVEVSGKYIVDVTEDQFHPDEEDKYRVGIYKKPNINYTK